MLVEWDADFNCLLFQHLFPLHIDEFKYRGEALFPLEDVGRSMNGRESDSARWAVRSQALTFKEKISANTSILEGVVTLFNPVEKNT